MRTAWIAWRILISLKNDKRTIGFILLAPILAMAVFAFAFSGQVHGVKIAVLNEDRGPLSREVISHLDPKVFSIENASSFQLGVNLVKKGKAWMFLYFPSNFTSNILFRKAAFYVYLDRSNVNLANALLEKVNEALLSGAKSLGISPPIEEKIVPVYGKNASFMDSFMPGVISLGIFLLSFLLSLISFISERSSGTLFRLYASPIRPYEIVFGYSLAFAFLSLFQVAEMFLVGIFLFHIKIVGNPFLAFFVGALLTISGVNLGLLLSSTVKRAYQAPQLVPFVVLPSFLLSGVFWPVEAIPTWMRPISYAIPLTYAVEALRSVALRGWGLSMIWPQVLALVAFALLFLGINVAEISRPKRNSRQYVL